MNFGPSYLYLYALEHLEMCLRRRLEWFGILSVGAGKGVKR